MATAGPGWLAPAPAPPAGWLRQLRPGSGSSSSGWLRPRLAPAGWLRQLRPGSGSSGSSLKQFKSISEHFKPFPRLRLRLARSSSSSSGPGWLRSAPAPAGSIGPLLAPIRSGPGWPRLAGYGYRLQLFPRLAPAPPAPIISPGWPAPAPAPAAPAAPPRLAPAPAFSHYRARANNEFPVGKFYHGAALRLDHFAPAGPASPLAAQLRPWRPSFAPGGPPSDPLQLRPGWPSFAPGGPASPLRPGWPPSDPLQRGPSKKIFLTRDI